MTEATVEQLQRELTAQAAAAQAALAAEQETSGQTQAQLRQATADLAAVREQLGTARAELEWLHRLHIDLNAVMEHRAVRALRSLRRSS